METNEAVGRGRDGGQKNETWSWDRLGTKLGAGRVQENEPTCGRGGRRGREPNSVSTLTEENHRRGKIRPQQNEHLGRTPK